MMVVFAIICWAYFPLVYFLYPETSRRTLEDMDEIFINNPSALVFKNAAMTSRHRPQIFIDAEERRIADGAAAEAGEVVLKGKSFNKASHIEMAV